LAVLAQAVECGHAVPNRRFWKEGDPKYKRRRKIANPPKRADPP
jgi:hypothetical protein